MRAKMVALPIKYLVTTIFICSLVGCQQDRIKPVLTDEHKNTYVIEANGELASDETAMINPPAVKNHWQYKITFLAPEGSMIEQGQPLVRFDSSQMNQNLAIKMSELKTTQKTLENTRLTNVAKLEKEKLDFAELKMKKEKELRKWEQSKGLESNLETQKLKFQFLLAENDTEKLRRTIAKTKESNSIKLTIAKNNVERLQNEIDEMQSDIKRMAMVAPKSGIVIYKPNHQGEKVSMGDTVWMGRQIIGLPSLDRMIVKAKILEADAGKIALGQEVEVTLDAAPERVFLGKISKLGRVFRLKSKDQPIIIFDAKITLNQPDIDLMRPGMAARLKILIDGNRTSQILDKVNMGNAR
jgi:HlyD family secretion protein